MKLRKLADEWKIDFKTLQNILDIKFVTYNREACVATLQDYEPVAQLAYDLKDDPSVKPKMKIKHRKQYNRMKDGRNLLNLVSLGRVLETISQYQTWGQLEKSSAFERKFARKQLASKMKSLTNRDQTARAVEKYLHFVDFEEKQMKNSKIKLAHWPHPDINSCVDYVLKKQVKIGNDFMKAKNTIHQQEDPEILDPLSDILT